MKTTVKIIGLFLTFITIILETILIGILWVLYFPLVAVIGMFFPIVKNTKIISFVNQWYECVRNWGHHYFIATYILNLWDWDSIK